MQIVRDDKNLKLKGLSQDVTEHYSAPCGVEPPTLNKHRILGLKRWILHSKPLGSCKITAVSRGEINPSKIGQKLD